MFKRGGRSLIAMLLVGGLIFALVAAFLGGLANDQEVVVAKVPLSAGTRLSAQVLEVKRINASAALPGAFQTIDELNGQILVAARMPGDQITQEMVGNKAISALAASLGSDRVAVALKVDQATGLAGVVRVGDTVGVIGIVTAQDLGLSDFGNLGSSTLATSFQATTAITSTIPRPSPTRSPNASGAAARVTLYDLRVLVVPQSFRYEETAPSTGDSTGGSFAPARTSDQAQKNSVIVVEVPIAPVEITPGYTVSPVELLSLLNAKGTLHFFLQPTAKTAQHPSTKGIDAQELLGKFYTK
jgi:Flp pilus assembly protein CpaB